ncbi:MAG TPA: T9SS type A sorting domain-containing protein [Bacteroidetes bacterium]|jgi:hypothetical protein|nr:T9SS type A sorting domain-containing protein [Bacteroidota bacterium]
MKLKFYIFLFFIFSFGYVSSQSYLTPAQNKTTTHIKHGDISIYPNPTVDYFHVNSDAEIGKIEIYNIIGKKIKTLENTNSNTFDVSDLRIGIYLVRIMDTNNKSLKVIRLSLNKQEP